MAADERKAFYLNAYNATAIAIVLERHPRASIREIPRSLRFDPPEDRRGDADPGRRREPAARVPGRALPLRDRVRRASPLRRSRPGPTARRASQRDLDVQGRVFVRDPARNVIDPAAGRLALSQMFEWNRKEFERDAESLASYVARFTEPAVGDWLKTFQKSPEFLPYDWALNQP